MSAARDPLSTKEVLALPCMANLEELRQCLYNHVMDAIDWGKIYTYEQMLWSLLPELGEKRRDVDEVAEKLIVECLTRAGSDPMRLISNVPPGITDAERRAVEYDDGCVFCRADAMNRDSEHGEHEDDDDCPLCTDMAADWRAQHQAVLKKAGLWRPPPS